MNSDAYYRSGEDLSFVPITHDEERELFVKAKAGDTKAKEKLIHDHLLLVANIARRLSKGRLPEDEIVSAANFALVSCFDRFDPAYPNRFAAFLKSHLRGAIARVWAEKNIVSKPDFSDGVAVVSVPVKDDAGCEEDADAEEHKQFLLKLSEQAKLVLDPREKEIIDLLFCETPTNQSDVARRLGVSRERIRQLTDGAMEKLRKELRRLMNLYGVNQL